MQRRRYNSQLSLCSGKVFACINKLFIAFLLILPGWSVAAPPGMPLEKANIDPRDQASLQRGAKAYMDFCSGCHSMDYMRYKRMAEDIGIVDADGQVDKERLEADFIYTDSKIQDHIKTALSQTNAEKWFGIKAPDLTLSARIRGVDWIYTYLRNFYADSAKMWGSNNRLFPDVAMPHVLVSLQGIQRPVYRTETTLIDGEKREFQVIDHLELVEPGLLTPEEYDQFVNDLVNFLAYTAAPERLQRERLGWWVLGFLVIFAFLAYLLKKEYWRDVN